MSLYTHLFDGEDTVSRNSPAMCTSVCPVSLLAVVVVAWVVHPTPVVCQCTTGHCHDDGDNDVSVLTAMVSCLQETVEQLQGQLQIQQRDASEQLQGQLQSQLRDATEHMQQQLRDSTEQQQKQLKKLTETLAKQEECMYCLQTSAIVKIVTR